jgi:hypothetical protein
MTESAPSGQGHGPCGLMPDEVSVTTVAQLARDVPRRSTVPRYGPNPRVRVSLGSIRRSHEGSQIGVRTLVKHHLRDGPLAMAGCPLPASFPMRTEERTPLTHLLV